MTYANWAYRVSPNAVISIVTTADRATLLFPVGVCLSQFKWNQYHRQQRLDNLQVVDQASRGLLGSLRLVTTTRPSLATLGAIVLILSVAIDPLAQQILTFPSRVVSASNETASAQTALVYLPSDPNTDSTMSLTVLGSTYGSSSSQEPVCSTGSCHYPDFVALGACSQCQDVTSQTKQSCSALSSNTTLGGESINSTGLGSAAVNCTYTTPGGLQITPTVYSLVNSPEYVDFTKHEWTFSTTGVGDLNLSDSQGPHYAGILNPVVALAVANYSNPEMVYTKDNLTALEQKPKVSECALYLCAQKYANNTYSSDHRSLAPSETEQLFVNHTFQMFGINNLSTSSNDSASFASAHSYSMQGITILEILNSFLSTITLMDKIDAGWTASLQDGDGASPVMKKIATGITDAIRSGPNTTTVTGEAFTTQTYISVRWYWAVAPIVITVMSIMFLIAMIIHTGRAKGVGVWKSSALALLACRLKQGTEYPDMHALGATEMETIAKRMHVSWDKDEPLTLSVKPTGEVRHV
ncbi:hypothetical protein BO94DRAFT_540123 [Aspergillus sclerotioniger CBS 115572]|uniref:Uncharacterized protein n=1 Tax=Aspergillus sclerotioniger CBS 115572 TaxID=1450535 RepID=A0A317V7L4_9EURO|nr:hypothetical protein BO94DRAFT_540123 [Aspergillus sclerotioniger CBS 115572]PWY68957.1 hypothetical protein BO94DRAFT_540123 [Aspergillus sclerotioniger CBS 115572]